MLLAGVLVLGTADRGAAQETDLCTSCHSPHVGTTATRYLLIAAEESVCLECHDGQAPPGQTGEQAPDILTQLEKRYTHPVLITPSAHGAGERPDYSPAPLPEVSPAQPRHAECPDCHNPHIHTGWRVGQGIAGPLSGVWGVTESGVLREPALFEYEICLKCHGDSANKPQPDLAGLDYPLRQTALLTGMLFNQRFELSPVNPSFHPVIAARGLSTGPGGEVPSLRPFMIGPGGQPLLDRPLGPGTVLQCIDCHNNDSGSNLGDGGADPAGPHGSAFAFLMERRYELEPPTVIPGEDGPGVFYTTDAYALCDKCHDVEGSVLEDQSFSLHDLHVREEDAACSTCHAPHGVYGGNPLNNTFLIDFDTRIVAPDGLGQLRFEDLGFRSGVCYLTCHGEEHSPESYPHD